MHLVSEKTLGLMNALKYHQCDTSPRCPQACGILRFYLQVICTRDQFCILPRMKKRMALFHIKNFSCTFKRKLQHAGHKWVMCGSHPDCSVGQWVNWVNRCDPLLTLAMQNLTDVQGLIACSITSSYTASDKSLCVS